MIDWIGIKQQPPFGDFIKRINPLLLKEEGALKTYRIGFLDKVDKDGLHFVDELNNDLNVPGSMVNPHGDNFNPTHWFFIEPQKG